ncbi:MAG: branched-chain amino acid ABC transporter permease [Gallionellales bacterium 35-53-114]|jgi:branched-chain amino acid transport system permease protein|nr:MAG: branched-chain amino acid ABC transporter permease [Gallionellales bacterium 35-53-114]OYZ63885.1 MAG: branched-chain amino acid ABC transporter permease [Gallionellales bacterium 24-53-125]OZB09284.1 MAG: branched-chain amino acid ABC transporter permease [Gallionellales bacterium 39-52-133]HQS59103.1 branched-chain amino acid ABC transporter permease [Gallionellaceae bacterium]HQS75839.1 branched-chain amino acid ABC transporter permease [Gallionellaceae bacterium]
MDILLQQIINGLVQGSVYALVALGYTMVYGILGLINFAHGEVVMVGAMIALAAIQVLLAAALSPLLVLLLSVLLAVAVCMALGYSIERIAYRPLRHAPRLAPLITAIGVSFVLQNLAMIIWGREYHSFPQLLPNASHHIGGAIITEVQITIVLIAILVMTGLMLLVHRTRLGRAMRAVAENQTSASLMGVNINKVISTTFMLGSALAAIAGIMVSANYGVVHYYMGFMLGLKAFTAAVLGGIGNLRGAMLGGVLLGLIESLGAGYMGALTGGILGSHYQDALAFVVLIAVLVFRPSGLLGERVSERA